MNFVRIKDHSAPLRITGLSESHFRVNGKWISKKSTTIDDNDDDELIHSLDLLTTSLPGWPLVEGIDLEAFTPMSHQFIAADMLATPWLSGLIEDDKLRRTRLIIADEGGTGKTLTASIAARWVSVNNLESGPIIILCPPLLIEEWILHLKAVFNDDPERVLALGSAKWFDPEVHKNRVIVVSKYSWAYRWNEVAGDGKNTLSQLVKQNPPSCVIIDEVHQGRARYGDEEVDESLKESGEDSSGDIQESEENCSDERTLMKAQKETCIVAATAIGISATPINLKVEEFNNILKILRAEQIHDDHLPVENDTRKSWMNTLGKIAEVAREKNEGELVPGELLSPLLNILQKMHKTGFLRVLDKSQFGEMENKLQELSTEDLNPAFALRLCRELHPWGRHLAMTLRVDLKVRDKKRGAKNHDEPEFRTRKERHVMINLQEKSPQYQEFLDTVECDDNFVGIHTNNRGRNWWLRTNLIHSHRWNPMTRDYSENSRGYSGPIRYSGVWTFNGGTFGQQIKDLDDPRLIPLADAIRTDIDGEGEEKPSRGCVIFTEFKGTVQSLSKQEKTRLIELIDRPNCELKIHILSGDVDYLAARRLLRRCEGEAKMDDEYPMLICTPAGEVGLNMAWATTLVHWDLHPNPQRLEQRTWRLDRRLKENTNFRENYLVLILTFQDRWITDDLITRNNDRYNRSCESLGLQQRQYIPDQNTEDRILRPGGTHHHVKLMDPEIHNAFDFVNEDLQLNEGRGFWMHQGERIRSFILFSMMTKLTASKLLHEGILPLGIDGKKVMTIGSNDSGMLRDIESISVEVAGRCWPSLSDGDGKGGIVTQMPQLSVAWNADSKRRLPVLRGAMTRLFPKTLSQQNFDRIPIVEVEDENLPIGEHIICVHRGLSKASRMSIQEGKLGIYLSDRGLRIQSNNLFKQKSLEDSLECANLCLKFVESCINSNYRIGDVPNLPPGTETKEIEERILELQTRKSELRRRLELYKKNRDEDLDDDLIYETESEDFDLWEMSMETRIDSIETDILVLSELPTQVDVIGVIKIGGK